MSNERKTGTTSQIARNLFGVIMIVIYVGMGVLLLCNYFKWMGDGWQWFRWIGGVLFIVYGTWRAYRQFKGIDKNVGDDVE